MNKFEIESKQLCDWLNNEEKFISVAPYIQKLNIYMHSKYPHLKDELMKWFSKLEVS